MSPLLMIPIVFFVPKTVLVSGYIAYKVYDKRQTRQRSVEWGSLQVKRPVFASFNVREIT